MSLSELEHSHAIGICGEILAENGEDSSKFVFYTSWLSKWIITVSNGERVWRAELGSEQLDRLNMDILKMRDCLQDCKLKVWYSSDDSSLTMGFPEATVKLELPELASIEELQGLGHVLFSMGKNVVELRQELAECKKQLSDQRKEGKGEASVIDIPMKSTGKGSSKPKKPVGHSIVNPSSRKRKAATGVNFGDD